MEKLEPWYIAGRKVNGAATLKNSMSVPQKKIKNRITMCPAIPLLGIYPKELKQGLEHPHL